MQCLLIDDALVATKLQSNQLKLARPQKELENAQEALKAFMNYFILWRNFHPLDISPAALFKVALEKFFIGPPKVAHYVSLFENSFMYLLGEPR